MKLGNWFVDSIQKGLLGGAVAILMSLVGMVIRFAGRSIIQDVVDLGHTLLLLVVFMVAFSAAKREYGPLVKLAAGFVAGLVSGLMVVLLVLLGGQIDMRAMFINASPELYAFLSFGNLALVPLIGAATGVMAAFFHFLPARLRNALITGFAIAIVIGTLSDQLLLILTNNGLAVYFRWLLAPKGLTLIGAGVVIVVVALINY